MDSNQTMQKPEVTVAKATASDDGVIDATEMSVDVNDVGGWRLVVEPADPTLFVDVAR